MPRLIHRLRSLASAAALAVFGAASQAAPTVILNHTALDASQLGLIINDADPLSRQIGEYYRQARGIPDSNIIHVRLPVGVDNLPQADFAAIKQTIDQQTPSQVQAYAVAWTQPFRVDCMSLTSALAFGFDKQYCSTQCQGTQASPYFNAVSRTPFSDFHLRPAMLLAARNFDEAKALIDRGVAADRSQPDGKAYLVETTDKARNVRAGLYAKTAEELTGVVPLEVVPESPLENKSDVLFYFTGQSQVAKLDTLRFQAGALADHLTSFGGQLVNSSQMSSLAWLTAGATASYGTVVEPCNHMQKFPVPAVAMFHYASGASAIEAYWKSVAWPGEGVFIGEPLAQPFAPILTELSPGRYELRAHSPVARRLRLEYAQSPMGPFRPIPAQLNIRRGTNRLQFNLPLQLDGFVRIPL